MVKQTTYGRSPDSDFETFDEDITGDHVALYKFGRSAKTDDPPHESVPLFLSGYNDEPDPREFTNLLRKRRPSVSSRILASVLVASAVAILFALFSSDDMRNIVAVAKVSIASMLPAPSAPAQPDSVQLTAEDIELLKDPARLSRPANQTSGVRSVTTVATAPSREEIPSAYQSATQSQAAGRCGTARSRNERAVGCREGSAVQAIPGLGGRAKCVGAGAGPAQKGEKPPAHYCLALAFHGSALHPVSLFFSLPPMGDLPAVICWSTIEMFRLCRLFCAIAKTAEATAGTACEWQAG